MPSIAKTRLIFCCQREKLARSATARAAAWRTPARSATTTTSRSSSRVKFSLEPHGEIQPAAGIEILIILREKAVRVHVVIAHKAAQDDVRCDRHEQGDANGMQPVMPLGRGVAGVLKAVVGLERRMIAEPPGA